MLNNSASGDIVYDPFLGSGTTLIAAEETGRVCYDLDVDPTYVDMIVRRWEKATGKQAVLESDGRTFREISAERSRLRRWSKWDDHHSSQPMKSGAL
jgi:DNA modification methylase